MQQTTLSEYWSAIKTLKSANNINFFCKRSVYKLMRTRVSLQLTQCTIVMRLIHCTKSMAKIGLQSMYKTLND